MQEKHDLVKVRIAIALIVAVLYVLGASAYGSGASVAEDQTNKIISQAR
ncbi:MAG TPA: hypothetical protein VHN74_14615 [Candidatus Angelobacter sp.]|jgi:hypothetical protein|nr:hypothetical protein [Candidatus Angelobacter sp.]